MVSCGASGTVFVRVWFADVFTGGIAGLAVCAMGYLLWLYFHEKLRRRKDQQECRRQRRKHWGYE
jgi:hypothetical protein